MIGAIVGDIIGSHYEFIDEKPSKDFTPLFHKDSRFTDDTVLTVALADSILNNEPYEKLLKKYTHRYSNVAYGKHFLDWAISDNYKPYNSWGNGSAMRTSPVGWAYNHINDVIVNAFKYASVTHNHEQGTLGATAVSVVIFLLRQGFSNEQIANFVERNFYSLDFNFDYLVKNYKFDVSCQGTVPVAIYLYLISTSFEDCIRNCVAVGGDTDTLCAIAGSIAEAKYGVPSEIRKKAFEYLPDEFINTITLFKYSYDK